MRAKQFRCFNNNRMYGDDLVPVKCPCFLPSTLCPSSRAIILLGKRELVALR